MNPIKTGDVDFIGNLHGDFPFPVPIYFDTHLYVMESVGAGKADIGI